MSGTTGRVVYQGESTGFFFKHVANEASGISPMSGVFFFLVFFLFFFVASRPCGLR